MTITEKEAAAILKTCKSALILTHRRADGDTVGSAVALCLAMRACGCSAFIEKNCESTPRFNGMTVKYLPPDGFEPELIVAVDIGDLSVLPAGQRERFEGKIGIDIDHHLVRGHVSERTLVDPSAAATGEIILRVTDEMGVSLTSDMARALYIAMSTDTGRFCFSNTTGNTLRAAARCYDVCGDIAAVNKLYFDTKTRGRIAIEAHIMNTLRFSDDGRVALAVLSRKDIAETGASPDDMDNIASLPAQAEGVCMALTMIENKNGSSRLSVRACAEIDAAAFCGTFGGGGHRGAAGAQINEPLSGELADKIFLSALEYVKNA